MHFGKHARRQSTIAAQAGFALAAMLVAIAILSVMLLVALPTWRHQVQREKEAELIFRGEQYARAIDLYQRKRPGSLPPTIELLVQEKFLRKKYKDPITGEDFVPVYANSPAGISAMRMTAQVSGGTVHIERATPALPIGAQVRIEARQSPGMGEVRTVQAETETGVFVRPSGAATGIIGVVSKSKEQSIRLYNGRDHYDQWVFAHAISRQPGRPAPGPSRPPGPPPPAGPGRGPGGGQ